MKIKKLIPYFLIFLCGLVYIPSFNNPFLWDDAVVIGTNPFIGSKVKIRAKDFFSKNYFSVSKEVTYRPAATALYYLTGIFSGKNPAGYRAVNMILNIIAGILVMVIGSRFYASARPGAPSAAGLFAGLLFVLHPIHSETVFIASFSEDILMTVFLLAAFLLYMDYRKKGNISALFFSALCFLLSCLSKETGVVFLGLLVFYEEFVLRGAADAAKTPANKWMAYGAYSIITFIYAMLRFVIFSNAVPDGISAYYPKAGYFGGSFLSNMAIVIPSAAEYVKLALVPFNLQVERVWSFSRSGFLAGIILLGWLLFAMFRYRRKSGLWAAFFLMPLLPVFNIIPFFSSPTIGERYLYLPTVGICVIAGMILCKLPSNNNPNTLKGTSGFSTIRVSVLVSILVLFAAAILERASDYKNELTFWKKAVEASPGSFKAHNSLGNAYKRSGVFEKAETHYLKSIEIMPDYAEALVNMGGLYDLQKKYKQAEGFYLHAAELNPFLVKAYSGLGIVYMNQDKLKEAEEMLKKAVEIDGTMLGSYYFLGQIYERENRLKESLAMYEKLMEYSDMDARELNRLGLLAGKIGNYEAAMKYFQKAVKSNPEYLDPAVNMGNTCFMMKKYSEAEEFYLRALEIEPNSVIASANLKKVREKRKL